MYPVRNLPLLLLLLLPQALAAQDMPLNQVLIDDQPWQLVGEGYQFTEGPAVTRDGTVYFTDVPANMVYRVGDDGKPVVFIDNSDRTSGLMFGPRGLYGCSSASQSILLFDSEGRKSVLCQGVISNDLVVTGQGAVYFTNPANKSIYYISPQGESRVVDEGIEFPNGLILWPDQKTLVVADMKGVHLWNFRVEKDGSLTHKQPYSTMQLPVGKSASGADGMTVDRDGRIYVATELGIQVFDTQGRLSGVIAKPQAKFLSNLVLGGPDFNLLYATSSDKVYRRQVKVTGFRFWEGD
jgi:sugar lactone lactonase YvrE